MHELCTLRRVQCPETPQRAWLQNATSFFLVRVVRHVLLVTGNPSAAALSFRKRQIPFSTKEDGNKKVPSDYVQNQNDLRVALQLVRHQFFSHAEVCLLSLGTRCDLTNPRRLSDKSFFALIHGGIYSAM